MNACKLVVVVFLESFFLTRKHESQFGVVTVGTMPCKQAVCINRTAQKKWQHRSNPKRPRAVI